MPRRSLAGFLTYNLDQVLQLKSTVVNRAPVMTAWATVVAERIGFRREEALSIGRRGVFDGFHPKRTYILPKHLCTLR